GARTATAGRGRQRGPGVGNSRSLAGRTGSRLEAALRGAARGRARPHPRGGGRALPALRPPPPRDGPQVLEGTRPPYPGGTRGPGLARRRFAGGPAPRGGGTGGTAGGRRPTGRRCR